MPTAPPVVSPIAPPTASAPQHIIERTPERMPESVSEAVPQAVSMSAPAPSAEQQPVQASPQPTSSFTPTWEEVVAHISQQKPPLVPSMYLQQVKGHFAQETLHIVTNNTTVYAKIESVRPALEKALHALCHRAICIKMDRPTKQIKPESTLIEEFRAHAQLKDCLEILDASIYKVRPLNDT